MKFCRCILKALQRLLCRPIQNLLAKQLNNMTELTAATVVMLQSEIIGFLCQMLSSFWFYF